MSPLSSLFLTPSDPLSVPPLSAVRPVLEQLQVIDAPIGPDTFLAGDGFARHVVYAGCSPYLLMQPPEDGGRQFCHVALHGPFERPRLQTGPHSIAPRCPACRARIADWREQLARAKVAETLGCPACGRRFPPEQLDWRGHAAAGRLMVELRNVFPGEASPSDQLMQALETATGEPWRGAWAPYLLE